MTWRAPRPLIAWALTVTALLGALSGVGFAEVDPAEGELLEQLSSGREGAQIHAATRLYHLGRADRAVELVAPRLGGADPDDRALAARVLGVLRSARALPALLSALDDEDWAVRRDAAEALGQIGQASASAALVRRLADPHPRVRIAAARSIAELSGPTAPLARALEVEVEVEVRMVLVEALADRAGGGLGREARQALRRALADPSELVRLLSAAHLIASGDPEAVEPLGERLNRSPSATARLEAAEALGRASGDASEPARAQLALALTDPTPEVGLAAAAALANLGDPRGLSHLNAVARGSGPPALRAQALALIESLEAR